MDTLNQKLHDQSFMSKHGGKVAVGTAVFLGTYFGAPAINTQQKQQLVQADGIEQVIENPTYNTVSWGHEAFAGETHTPTDATLSRYMNQPVEQTLGIQGQDWTKVDHSNYQTEVLGADRPVMVVFYGKDTATSKGSQGIGALARAIHDEFPEIKVCGFDMKYKGIIPQKRFASEFMSKYPVKKAPSLIFYDNDSGKNKYEGRINGGIETLAFLKQKVAKYTAEIIPTHILD